MLHTLVRHKQTSADKLHPGVNGPVTSDRAENEPCHTKTSRQRLAEAVGRLERLDAERERRGNPRFGKTAEARIIWGELIELELQEIDEQVGRICAATGWKPRAPVNLREGGAHERDDS